MKSLSKLHIWILFVLSLMVLLTLIVHPSHAQFFQTVQDQTESMNLPAGAIEDSSPLKPRHFNASPTPSLISIPAPSREKMAAETVAVSTLGTPYPIGFGRDVPQLGSASDMASHLQWQNTPQSGIIAAISITSPQAVGLRLGVLVSRLPSEAILRFYAQGAKAAYEISGKEVMETIKRNLDAGDSSDAARTYWSPDIEGEEATLEIELPPGIGTDTVEISIPRISHFFLQPLAVAGGDIIKSVGDSDYCELDATCYSAWSSENNAAAKMSFVGTDGGSYICTGTLLNDTISSGTPYFLSANHCISQQTEASTLQTYWFYRSTSCNSGTLNPGNIKLTGGATLLYTSSNTDTSFLRLNNTPPTGVIYAGWSADAAALSTSVTGIHHPKGDLQKISFGLIESFQDCLSSSSSTFTCTETTQQNAEYLNITFTSGTTEGGSSGSGLFRTDGSNHYLIGQLRGGNSSCSNLSGTNRYGRFDVAYNAALRQWLNPSTSSALYFPHVATIDSWQTEIAIINTGNQTVTGTLKAFSNEGQQIETKTVSLVAYGRRQIIIGNEFTDHANIGHIIFATTSDTVHGYIKFYQEGIYRVAIPAVKEVNTSDIYVPHIASSSEWWTGLSLVNTNATAKTLTINFNDGQTKQITLAANGHSAFAIRDLFNSQPQPGIQSAVITNASGIIGLELFGSFFGGRQLEGVLLTDKSALTLYYPHVENSGWWTGIVAYNPSSSSCSITTTSYSTIGSYLSSSTQSISGRQKLVGTTDQLGIPSQTAWFKIDSTKPLNGFELISTNSYQLLAAYGMNGGTGTKAGVFAKIEKNGWTTIALVNIENTTATVTMTAYTDNGTVVATQMLYIGSRAKLLNSAEGLFPQNIASATYIAYISDKNMVGLQLNGNSDWTMLDGLPVLAGVDVPPVVCNYSISPTSKTFNSSSGTGSVNVTTTSGCSWTASTNEDWIAITAGSSGSGNGTVSYSISANTGTSARSGAMTIAGKTFTVSQSGASVTSDALIGNYKFVFNISTSTFTDRITMNTKSSSKTSEGTDIYTGYSADYPSVVMAAGAWYPSLSKYIIVTARTYASSFMDAYYFSINADNTLPGCYKLSSDDGNTWSSNCYSFLIPASHKTPLGSWDMLTESDTDYMDINEVNSKKIAEDKQAHTQRIESSSTLDNDLVPKINELMAIIKNHR